MYSACRSRWTICEDTSAGLSRVSGRRAPRRADPSSRKPLRRRKSFRPGSSRRAPQAVPVPPHLLMPIGKLHAERNRLGMDPVRPADHRRHGEAPLPGRFRTPRTSSTPPRIMSAASPIRTASPVSRDVGRCHSQVKPARLRARSFRHVGEERDDVVLDLFLMASIRADRAGDLESRRLIRPAVPFGTFPSFSHASQARSSTSSQTANRRSGSQSRPISGAYSAESTPRLKTVHEISRKADVLHSFPAFPGNCTRRASS